MPVYHTYRTDGFGATKSSKLTPIKAIRLQCKECYGFSPSYFADIEDCPSELCPLFPFRHGKDPSLKGRARSQKQKDSAEKRGKELALLAKSRNMTQREVNA